MDQQNILFLGCLTLALAISAFILWGPSPRPRKRKGQIVGLMNLGSTCFLNTLLQALASCAFFIQWLMQQKQDENSLTSTISDVLWVLNGEGKGEAHAPVEVLSALKRHGWMVPSGEQDAHELFHVIVTTLQEENKKVVKSGSLSDALPASDTLSQSSDILDDPLDLQCEEIEQSTITRIETGYNTADENGMLEKLQFAHGDNGSAKLAQIPEESSLDDSSSRCIKVERATQGDSATQSSTEKFYSCSPVSDMETNQQCGDVEESTLKLDYVDCKETNGLDERNTIKSTSPKFKTSLENLRDKSFYPHGCYDRATGKSPCMPASDAPPFQGLLTSSLQCSACGYYSSLHYDTFDSLSLPLGDNSHFQMMKLQDLLRKFVKTEIIPEVDCEKCCKKTTAFKTMNFGKLPNCLCIHIARTTWQKYSHTSTKRDDFVDFPEYLPMDEYTVSARLKKGTSASSIQSVNSETSLVDEKTVKHLYRLKSVVVHLGDVSSGHFLTYRRGALNSLKRHRIGKLAGAYKDSKRWYLTSDDSVKPSTLRDAMESLAYMLFYEKCTSDMISGDDDCT